MHCRYWNDPAVLKKLGAAMGDVFDFNALVGAEGRPEDEDEDEDEAEPNLHTAASDGTGKGTEGAEHAGESWFGMKGYLNQQQQGSSSLAVSNCGVDRAALAGSYFPFCMLACMHAPLMSLARMHCKYVFPDLPHHMGSHVKLQVPGFW
jgi:hypothetical protein